MFLTVCTMQTFHQNKFIGQSSAMRVIIIMFSIVISLSIMPDIDIMSDIILAIFGKKERKPTVMCRFP